MSTEKKVDVLAVLDKHIVAESGFGYIASAKEAMEARDAVAEMIEACQYMSARSTTEEWSRFHNALARVGGAP